MPRAGLLRQAVLDLTETFGARYPKGKEYLARLAELEAARAAGMRPMVASGLAKVRDGDVSVEELDRVLRFSG